MKFYFFRNQSSSLLALIAVGAIGVAAQLDAQSLTITGVQSQTIGTTAILSGSGSKENTTTFATGTAGVFAINGGSSYMRVSTSNNTGSLVLGRDALMVARTVDSQGLMDQGTLSIYVRPATTNPDTMATGRWTLDVNFAFFSDVALTTPLSTNLLLTSLDIDFAQRYYTKDSTFSSNLTYSGTDLIAAPSVTGYTGFTTLAGADATVNDPEHAVSSAGIGSSFDIQLSHDNLALFMFEFRDPPTVIGMIPETSSALLAMGGISLLALMRRRQRTA